MISKLFLCLSFFATCVSATIFEEGPACRGCQHLTDLTNKFDKGNTYDQSPSQSPFLQPIHNQLRNVDQNLKATTKDVVAIFKTILTLRYHNNPIQTQTADAASKSQFLAYQIMDTACEIMLKGQVTLATLRRETIKKAKETTNFSDDYIAALIPDTAIDMIQHPEIPNTIAYQDGFKSKDYTEQQGGVLLGSYNRDMTLINLSEDKTKGKAIYLILGRGNRQPAPEGQKTADGRSIVWIYLDGNAQSHSTNRDEYFLWEDFNGFLGRRLPEDFFDAVIFDNSVTKFMKTDLLTVIQIAKILISTGFFMFPPNMLGGLMPWIYEDSPREFTDRFIGPGLIGWPIWAGDAINRNPRSSIQGDEREKRYEELYTSLVKCLQKIFAYLFGETHQITNDNELGFKLADYNFTKEHPGFRLRNPKKETLKKNPRIQLFYW